MDPLVVSVVAIVVALLAAGFTGWQAITAHLARTSPGKATFVISKEHEGSTWRLHNTGGSVATDVEVTVTHLLVRDPEQRTSTFSTREPVHPGTSVPLPGTSNKSLSRDRWRPKTDNPDLYEHVPKGEPGGEYMVGEYATVTWYDYRGRQQKGRTRLR